MKMLACVALVAMVAATVSNQATAATNERPSYADNYALRFVKKIGVGWRPELWRIHKFGWMSFVSFGRNGEMVASDGPSAPDDTSGDLTMWSFPRGRLIKRVPGRPWSISGDWKYYADQHSVRDTDTGKPIISLSDKVYATYAFSPDGRYVAEAPSSQSSPNSHIQIFELATGKLVAAFGRHYASSIVISPDGRTLASGHWNLITLWNMHTGKRIGALRGIGRYVDSLSFSKDGKLLAAGTDSGRLQIWNVRRHKVLHSIDVGGGYVSEPAFSPNGRLVAIGVYGTGTIWLVDVRNGQILDHQKVSDLGCGSVAFSPDGRFLIAPSTGGLITWPYDRGGTIRVFKLVRRGVSG